MTSKTITLPRRVLEELQEALAVGLCYAQDCAEDNSAAPKAYKPGVAKRDAARIHKAWQEVERYISMEKIEMDQHYIGYACPTSEIARRCKKYHEGCFFVADTNFTNSQDAHTPFNTYEEALAYAKTKGTRPNRWSLDHPANKG